MPEPDNRDGECDEHFVRKPGEPRQNSGSYYYDDSTNYEIYREEPEEDEPDVDDADN